MDDSAERISDIAYKLQILRNNVQLVYMSVKARRQEIDTMKEIEEREKEKMKAEIAEKEEVINKLRDYETKLNKQKEEHEAKQKLEKKRHAKHMEKFEKLESKYKRAIELIHKDVDNKHEDDSAAGANGNLVDILPDCEEGDCTKDEMPIKFSQNEIVEALDPKYVGQIWYKAKILALNEKLGTAYVHFDGWDDSYNATLDVSKYIRKLNSSQNNANKVVTTTTKKRTSKKGRYEMITEPDVGMIPPQASPYTLFRIPENISRLRQKK